MVWAALERWGPTVYWAGESCGNLRVIAEYDHVCCWGRALEEFE
jgi:hypothetical protein